MAEIVLDGVTKRYPDGALAVQHVDLEIADGEFVILVGPSGCGKSTTLNMIAGLEDITEGELRVGGEVVNNKAPKDRDIAMVFQNYALYPHMTVRQNMAFPLTLAKIDKAEIRRKVEEAAEVLELTEHLDRKPANLSGGQRQRVAMGRAIVRAPKAFLMDEPLSNLDAKLRVQMRTQVSRLQKRLGTTTVYVTHDQTEAMTLGDRVVVMRGGLVQQVGTPKQLYETPTNLFVAGFIGSPAMNFLPATLENDRLRTPIGEINLTAAQRAAVASHRLDRDVIIGLRPEDFADASLIDKPDPAATFGITVDVMESMGSDVFIYFDVAGGRISTDQLDDVDTIEGSEDDQIVARLAPETAAREGESLDLWFDANRIHIFDPATGTNVTAMPELTADDGAVHIGARRR